VPLISSFVILYIFGYVVGQRKKQDVNLAFALLLLDFFMLAFLDFISHLGATFGRLDYQWIRVFSPFAVWNGFLLLNFVVAMAEKKRGTLYYLSAAVAIAGTLFVFLPNIRLAEMPSGTNQILPTYWFNLMTVLFIFPPELYAAFVAVSAYRNATEETIRRNYIFLFTGTISAAVFYFLGKIILPFEANWFIGDRCSTVAFVIFALVLYRAISKHKFMSFDREKELARARQIESLGLLAGGIAHDYNNLLTGIMTSFSLIKNIYKGADPSVTEIASQGVKASEQAAKLTRQLLTFAKGGEPILESVNAAALISEAVEFVLHGSSCTFRVDMSPEANGIFADRGQLVQVFQNLAMNARQAMISGGAITVTGRKRIMSKNENPHIVSGDYIEIVFADTGNGIDPDHIDRIFDPYFTTKPEGSGLGLTTTYSIVKKHKGHITVKSEKGRGTSFTLLLPLAKGTIPGKAESRQPELSSLKGRILVVDDEKIVRTLLEKVLNLFGFTTESAQNADEALRIFDAGRETGKSYICCILDLTMPGGMNGTELGTALLAKDPSLKIILSSGYHDDPVMAKFRDYGFAGILQKPYNIEKLRAQLETVFAAS
jgi:signal transduction histidine kinase/CheY-like chemotaxis protein